MTEASHNSPGSALTENSQLSASNPRPIFNEPEYLRIHHPPSDASPSPRFPPSYPCENILQGCGLLSHLRHLDQRRNTTHPRHRISNYPREVARTTPLFWLWNPRSFRVQPAKQAVQPWRFLKPDNRYGLSLSRYYASVICGCLSRRMIPPHRDIYLEAPSSDICRIL